MAVIALTSETPVKVRTQHLDSTRGKLTRVEGYRLQLPSTPHDHGQDPGPRLGERGKLHPKRVNWSVHESEAEIPQTQTPFLTAALCSLMSCVSVAEDTHP